MRAVWEAFTDWLVGDIVCTEERALMRAEAERLVLRTKLQAERLAKRKAKAAARAKAAKEGKTLAILRHKHKTKRQGLRLEGGWLTVVSQYALGTSVQDDGLNYRQVKPLSCVRADNHAVVREALIDDFLKNQPVWLEGVQPWLDGTISTKQLAEAWPDEITLLPSRTKEK